MRPSLFIFDCDGVLVDSENIANTLLSENLTRHGLAIGPEECLRYFQGGSMLDVPAFAKTRGVILPDGWVDAFYVEMYAELEKGVSVIDGIPALLQTLDDLGIPCCVASNGAEEKMRITLGQNGMWDRFADACFSGHRYGKRKPDPTIFLAAADHFSVDASDVMVVEDSIIGAKAAANAHMRCFGYAPHGDGAELAAEGAVVIHTMREIIDFLEAQS
ncbi:MAG: HAD family phosphatase [Alphaproteobacteria bacterium]